jgi:hypothetical protein
MGKESGSLQSISRCLPGYISLRLGGTFLALGGLDPYMRRDSPLRIQGKAFASNLPLLILLHLSRSIRR